MFYVNLYTVERLYLGPEEGGRWGNRFMPEESTWFEGKIEADRYSDKLKDKIGPQKSLGSMGTSCILEVKIEREPGREVHPDYIYS